MSEIPSYDFESSKLGNSNAYFENMSLMSFTFELKQATLYLRRFWIIRLLNTFAIYCTLLFYCLSTAMGDFVSGSPLLRCFMIGRIFSSGKVFRSTADLSWLSSLIILFWRPPAVLSLLISLCNGSEKILSGTSCNYETKFRLMQRLRILQSIWGCPIRTTS